MKNKKLIPLYLLSLLFINCNNDNSSVIEPISDSAIATLKDYQDFLNTETTGALLIQSFETNNSTNGATFSTATSIKGNRMPLTLKIDNTIISFENYYYSKSADKSFSNLDNPKLGEVFGKTFKVELINNQVYAKKSETSDIESTYIPEIIHPNFINLKDEETVVPGTQITWNADPKNTKGVIVNLDFDPSTQTAEISKLNPNRIAKALTLVDNGSYTITAEDLETFPSNSLLNFYVGRSGFSIAIDTSNNNDYAIGAMTAWRADFIIQK